VAVDAGKQSVIMVIKEVRRRLRLSVAFSSWNCYWSPFLCLRWRLPAGGILFSGSTRVIMQSFTCS